MTGTALRIALFVGLGVCALAQRVDAQSEEDVEEVSTGDASEESSSADSISDEISFDDDLSDDFSSSSSAKTGIRRPQTPLQPTD
jgi:nucleosome binding factor SPN SPT16 subunit